MPRNNIGTSHPTRCKSTHIFMALTEEFIQMKVNGDVSSFQGEKDRILLRDSFNSNSNINSQSTSSTVATTTFAPPKRRLPPSDVVGYFALSRVKSLARFAGIAMHRTGMTNSDSYESGGGNNSNREEFLNWQRQNLAQARREVAEGGVRSALIAALPSSKRQIDENEDGNMRKNVDRIRTHNKTRKKHKSNKSEETNDNPTTITKALQTLERDMSMLDNLASLQPQLSVAEVGLLLGAVVASGIGPIVFPGTSVTEVLAPAAAACEFCLSVSLLSVFCCSIFFCLMKFSSSSLQVTASITIGSEYIGRVAVADGKEIAGETRNNLFYYNMLNPLSAFCLTVSR